MFKSNFDQLEEWAWDVAKITGLPHKEKKIIYTSIIDTVTQSCFAYENDSDFKEKINNYHKKRVVEVSTKG